MAETESDGVGLAGGDALAHHERVLLEHGKRLGPRFAAVDVGAVGEMEAVFEFHPKNRVSGGRRSGDGDGKIGALGKEADGVLKQHLVDQLRGEPSAPHFHRGLGHGEGVAYAPVARGIEPNALPTADFEHVDGARRGGF